MKRTILTIAILAMMVFLAACQPKVVTPPVPEPQEETPFVLPDPGLEPAVPGDNPYLSCPPGFTVEGDECIDSGYNPGPDMIGILPDEQIAAMESTGQLK